MQVSSTVGFTCSLSQSAKRNYLKAYHPMRDPDVSGWNRTRAYLQDTWTFSVGDHTYLCGSFNRNDAKSNGITTLWPDDEAEMA